MGGNWSRACKGEEELGIPFLPFPFTSSMSVSFLLPVWQVRSYLEKSFGDIFLNNESRAIRRNVLTGSEGTDSAVEKGSKGLHLTQMARQQLCCTTDRSLQHLAHRRQLRPPPGHTWRYTHLRSFPRQQSGEPSPVPRLFRTDNGEVTWGVLEKRGDGGRADAYSSLSQKACQQDGADAAGAPQLVRGQGW
jgi:hypothetical protein